MASMASMASTEMMVASKASMDASMASLASVAPTALMALASVALVASRTWVSDLSRRKLSNEMLRFSPLENWLGSSTKQTWVDDGLSVMDSGWWRRMVASMDGVDGGFDGWRRWMASMVGVDGGRVFDTKGTDVEVPSGEGDTHSGSLLFV